MMIKVLWVDDQHLEFRDFKDNAKEAGISLVSVDNKDSAEDKLEKETFDAVILDANFKKSENDEIENKNADWLLDLNTYIERNHKELKVFVLTGNLYNYDDDKRTMITNIFKERLKIKGEDEDELLEDIINHHYNKEDNKIKRDFHSSFQPLAKASEEKLLLLIKQMNNNEKINYNNIRSVLESTFHEFSKKEFAPNLMAPAGIMHLYCGRKTKILFKKPSTNNESVIGPIYELDDKYLFPETIQSVAQTLWSISRTGSHSKASSLDKREGKPFYKNNPGDLLSKKSIHSLVLLLCDFLTFVNGFFQLDSAKKKWKEISPGSEDFINNFKLNYDEIKSLKSNCSDGDQLINVLEKKEKDY